MDLWGTYCKKYREVRRFQLYRVALSIKLTKYKNRGKYYRYVGKGKGDLNAKGRRTSSIRVKSQTNYGLRSLKSGLRPHSQKERYGLVKMYKTRADWYLEDKCLKYSKMTKKLLNSFSVMEMRYLSKLKRLGVLNKVMYMEKFRLRYLRLILSFRRVTRVLLKRYKVQHKVQIVYNSYKKKDIRSVVKYLTLASIPMWLLLNVNYFSNDILNLNVGWLKLYRRYQVLALSYAYLNILKFSDMFYWRYKLEFSRVVGGRFINLLRWNAMTGWKRQLRREFELYGARLGKIYYHLNTRYFMRSKLRSYYGIVKHREYKNILKRLSKPGYRIRHGGSLTGYLNLFELRLATLVYRLHFVDDIYLSKSLIKRGLFTVNGNVEYNPDHVVCVGDVISVVANYRSEGMCNLYRDLVRGRVLCGIPKYVILNYNTMSGIVWRNPTLSEIGYPTSGLDVTRLIGDVKMLCLS